jgi:uncharacterized protein YjbI with pentapeptide repeats
MAKKEHIEIIKRGKDDWNEWRRNKPNLKPDLSGVELQQENLQGVNFQKADLEGANFQSADLRYANFREAFLVETNFMQADLSYASLDYYSNILRPVNLRNAILRKANLTSADLSGAWLVGTDLEDANLFKANLGDTSLQTAKFIRADLRESNLMNANFFNTDMSKADMRKANLRGADLRKGIFYETDLREADLRLARIVDTNLEKANLEYCFVYGVSAWNTSLKGANQRNLIISDGNEPLISVDNLEVAQFIYLLLNNDKIRDVIDTIGKKAVLILGRFTPERKKVLDAIRNELRKKNFLPILFDFEKPQSRDLTETVSTLAHLSRFIIADITDAKSIPQELQVIIPNLPSVYVQPIIYASNKEYGMFEHFKKYPWVLPLFKYKLNANLTKETFTTLIKAMEDKINETNKNK